MASTSPLPAHSVPTKLYELEIYVPDHPDNQFDNFCVDNIIVPPAGLWEFVDPTLTYAPSFNGISNSGVDYPDAPDICFMVLGSSPFGWSAFTHKTPDQSCPPWIAQQFNGAPAPVLTGDNTLTITTNDYAQNAYYAILDPNIPTGDLTIEFGLQVISGDSWSSEAPAAVQFSRGDGWHNFLFIGVDQIFLWTSEGVPDLPVYVDTDSRPHFYKIVVYANGLIQVYRDGWHIISYLMIYHPAYTTRLITFGEFCDHANGISKWSYFRYNYSGPPCNCCNLPGDANSNGVVNALDITFLINYLYKHGTAPTCPGNADANGNGTTNALDITYLINNLYKHGAAPKCP